MLSCITVLTTFLMSLDAKSVITSPILPGGLNTDAIVMNMSGTTSGNRNETAHLLMLTEKFIGAKDICRATGGYYFYRLTVTKAENL